MKTIFEKIKVKLRIQHWFRKTENREKKYINLMDSLKYTKPGRKFTREEMNQR